MSSRRALAWGCEFKVQTGVTVLNQAVSVCLPAFQLNSLRSAADQAVSMDFLSARHLLKKAKDLCVSVQKCFDFQPPFEE